MNPSTRQLICVLAFAAYQSGCGGAAPRVSLETPSGQEPLASWYGVFVVPLEGPNSSPIAKLLVAFVDPTWGCQGDFTGDAVSFSFDVFSAGSVSSTVLSRSGPLLGPSSGGSGQVAITRDDDRYQGMGDMGPIVGSGGIVDGTVDYDFGGGLKLAGTFVAPNCAALNFRNAP